MHFLYCEKFHEEAGFPFPGRFAQDILSDLKLQFNDRFSDLDARTTEIRIFQNQFDCVIDEVPPEFQVELIDLQSSNVLKDKYIGH